MFDEWAREVQTIRVRHRLQSKTTIHFLFVRGVGVSFTAETPDGSQTVFVHSAAFYFLVVCETRSYSNGLPSSGSFVVVVAVVVVVIVIVVVVVVSCRICSWLFFFFFSLFTFM